MNQLMSFENPRFGEIRTITEGDRTLFCAKDVAALGYKDTTNAIKQHYRGVVKRHLPHPQASDKRYDRRGTPVGLGWGRSGQYMKSHGGKKVNRAFGTKPNPSPPTAKQPVGYRPTDC